MDKRLTIASNMWNEIDQLPEWFAFVKEIADGGILIVDSGSTDGSIEYARSQGAHVAVDNIIQKEGYGPARNQLLNLSREIFKSHWMMFLDADERIVPSEFHYLRFIKEYLHSRFDIVAFPRIDWHDKEMTKAENDYIIAPDWQARMIRLSSSACYVRKLHEQIAGYTGEIYANVNNPKINHLHRSASKEKRDRIGKLCAKLHMEDKEFGHTYPEHPKEAAFRERYLKEGL